MEITLEQLTHGNYSHALEINRDDIPEAWVDNAAYLMDLTDYGVEHHLIGHTFLARLGIRYVGIILIGEAIPWDTDPDEMKGRPFYRVMGFVVDRNYRSRGNNYCKKPCICYSNRKHDRRRSGNNIFILIYMFMYISTRC